MKHQPYDTMSKLMNSVYSDWEVTGPYSTRNIPHTIKVYRLLELDFKLILSRFIHDEGRDTKVLSNV